MKKIITLLFIALTVINLSSCVYTDETYVPQPTSYYGVKTIDVYSTTQSSNFINLYFNSITNSGRDYYFLLVQDYTGNIYFNGKYWKKVSDDYWYSPMSIYVDGFYLQHNRTYHCVVMSSWNNFSQEFNLNIY
jgi:hypothetical protein